MSQALFIAFTFLTLVASTVIPRLGPIDTHVPLTYQVQIDDPPMTRWEPIIRDFNHSVHRFA